MKIHYIGLSSFLIENEAGYRILVDPFSNDPKWTLGPRFPETFQGETFGANIVLMSEPDADHSYAPGGWLQHAPETKPNANPFPDLALKGTVIYEWNGDLNIAYHYTVDGIRLAHFADNAHELTPQQLMEFGEVDIAFISPQKMPQETPEIDMVTKRNIELLNPKVVIWAHHIAPEGLPDSEDKKELRPFFEEYFAKNAKQNINYKGPESFMQLCYLLENAYVLNNLYNGLIVDETSLQIDQKFLKEHSGKTVSILFRNQLAR